MGKFLEPLVARIVSLPRDVAMAIFITQARFATDQPAETTAMPRDATKRMDATKKGKPLQSHQEHDDGKSV